MKYPIIVLAASVLMGGFILVLLSVFALGEALEFVDRRRAAKDRLR